MPSSLDTFAILRTPSNEDNKIINEDLENGVPIDDKMEDNTIKIDMSPLSISVNSNDNKITQNINNEILLTDTPQSHLTKDKKIQLF